MRKLLTLYTLCEVRTLIYWVCGQASFCALWLKRQAHSRGLPGGLGDGPAVEAWGNMPALLRTTNPSAGPRLLCRGMAWVDGERRRLGFARRLVRQPKRCAHRPAHAWADRCVTGRDRQTQSRARREHGRTAPALRPTRDHFRVGELH